MNLAIMKDEDNNFVKLARLKIIIVQSSDPDAILFKESYADELFKKAIVVKKKRNHNSQSSNLDLQKAYPQKLGQREKKRISWIWSIKASFLDITSHFANRYNKTDKYLQRFLGLYFLEIFNCYI